MSTGEIAPSVPHRLRRPGRLGRAIVAIAVALIVAVAAFGLYEYESNLPPNGEATLVVYTYPSLFGGVDCSAPAFATVFGAFGASHHVRVEVECPPGTLLSTLLEEKGSAGADVVIGLDELTTPVAEANHLLVPYRPPSLENVPSALVSELSPDYGAAPYEYGYLAIDYNLSFAASTDGAVAHASFSNFTSNATWAKGLLTENPEYDITGEEFLAWQIEYYEQVLHENWTTFWTSMPRGAPPLSDSWDEAFAAFSEGASPMVVSYSTDPAYAAFYGAAGYYNSTVSWWNGTEYGWRTVYGIGIVNGTRHLALDEAFENWFLSGTVQSEIPTNEWEYPANTTVPLPGVFADAIPPGPIVVLNDDTSPAAVGAAIPGWVATWEGLEAGAG